MPTDHPPNYLPLQGRGQRRGYKYSTAARVAAVRHRQEECGHLSSCSCRLAGLQLLKLSSRLHPNKPTRSPPPAIDGEGRRRRTPSPRHPGPVHRCCCNGGRGDLGAKPLTVAETESSRGDRRLAGDLPEQAFLLLAPPLPEQRRHAHRLPGLEPPLAALLHGRRPEQVDPLVGRRRRLAPPRPLPPPALPPRQGISNAIVPVPLLLVRPPRLPLRCRQPHVRLGLRLPPCLHGLARRCLVARLLGALRPRHRQEQAEPLLHQRRGGDHGGGGDRRDGLRVGPARGRHGPPVRAGLRPRRAGLGPPRPHLRALGARLRQGPGEALLPRGAGAAGGRVALRVRVHLRWARRRRGLPGDAARGGAVCARRRGCVCECDGVDGRHVPAGRARWHRRAVLGVHRPRRRVECCQGAADECCCGDLVP